MIKRWCLLAGLCLLAGYGLTAADSDSINWLQNGNFDGAGGWSTLNLSADRGGKVLHLQNAAAEWNASEQTLALPDPAPASLEISGWMKTKDVVKGEKEWQMARIYPTFLDAGGQVTGGWPEAVAQIQGSTPWTAYSNLYKVPAGARSLRLSLQLEHASGEAWFSGMKVVAYNYDNKPLAPGQAADPKARPAARLVGDNWLANAGFEDLGSSAWENSKISTPGRESSHALFLRNDAPSWNSAKQAVPFGAQHPATAVLGGWLKTQDVVQGAENYMTARLVLNFYDDANNLVAGYQASAASVAGTTPWTHYEHAYPVPAGATRAVVEAGLGNCLGQAWWDDLNLAMLDDAGARLKADIKLSDTSDTSDWWAYQTPSDPAATPLDLSFLADAPAGRHGFILAKEGHFVFSDGTPARFWGTDLVGSNAFPTHEQADQEARRLARLGVNLARLHHMDAAWANPNIFDKSADTTQVFSQDSLDRLDYLIAALKKNGIYIYPDLLVHRVFREGDNVADYKELEAGAKGAIHFSRRLIDLDKAYAKALFSHVNPYTGLALKDDPVVLGTEMVNESTIFCGFGPQDFPPSYQRDLQRLYEAWGGKGQVTYFHYDYEKARLKPVRNPENADASLKFLAETEAKGYREMRNYLHSLGAHALVNGSNIGLHILAEIRNNAQMDYMDNHNYWDHPQVWKMPGGWAQVDIAPFDNQAQLTHPFGGALVYKLADWRVEGKPFLVTEWNDCFPNEYRLEGPLLMAAYGCLQDWDGMLQFDYGLEAMGSVKMTAINLHTRPDNEALYQAAALIYRGRMLEPSKSEVVETVDDQQVFTSPSASDWLAGNSWLPYAVKVSKRFTGETRQAPADLSAYAGLHDDAAKLIKASTGQAVLDYGRGILVINAPKVQGLAGAIGQDKPLKAGLLTATLAKRNPWAQVLAISLDNKPLASSARFAVVAVARAENTGQVFNPTHTALKEPGTAPILMQGVQGEINLAGLDKNKSWSVRPLNEAGQAGKPLPVGIKGGIDFKILSRDHATFYLVESK